MIPLESIGAEVNVNKALVLAQAEQLRDVSLKALEVIAQITKTLMDASGHAHLMIQDPVFRLPAT